MATTAQPPPPDLIVATGDYSPDGLDRGAAVCRAIQFCMGLPQSPRTGARLEPAALRAFCAQPCFVVVADATGPHMEAALAGIHDRSGSIEGDPHWCFVLPLTEAEPLEPGGRVRSIELAAFEFGGYLIEKARRAMVVAAAEAGATAGELSLPNLVDAVTPANPHTKAKL